MAAVNKIKLFNANVINSSGCRIHSKRIIWIQWQQCDKMRIAQMQYVIELYSAKCH